MMKCFAYLRVSSVGQVDGDGWTRQLLACEQYAAANGFEIAEVFRESMTGTSDLEDRPQLAALLAALEENGIKTVLVEKMDRVARDLLVQETIIGDMLRRGYTVISTMEPDLCSTDPSRVLIRQIFGALAQYDRAMIVAKTLAARKRIREKTGKCEGRKFFGENAGEGEALTRMLELRSEGWTLERITGDLNRNGFQTRMGKPWALGSVAKILARHRKSGI